MLKNLKLTYPMIVLKPIWEILRYWSKMEVNSGTNAPIQRKYLLRKNR